MTELRDAILLGPAEGSRVTTAGTGGTAVSATLVKAMADDTRGAYALRENAIPPGRGMAHLHTHHGTEEAFIVLEGKLTFQLGDQQIAMGPGSFALVPRGVPHTFGNLGDQPARYLLLLSPPGFERFFEELADLRSSSPDGYVDAAALEELATKYQTVYFNLPARV